MHCVSIRSIAFKSFKTWFWNLSLSIESVDYGVWSFLPLCMSSSKRDCSNLYEIGTWYFNNVNEGSDYTPLQSCLSVERSTGSLGVIGNAELFWLRVLWGGGEGSGGGRKEREEGETKSPQVKKKKKKHFEPSIFTSSLFLINKWIPFCCASVRQDVTDAARTKEKHKKRSSFLTFT